MKKGKLTSIIIVIAVILGIGLTLGYKHFSKDKDGNKISSYQKSNRQIPVEEINVKKIPNSKEIIVNVKGDKNINNLVVAEVLEENDIEGVEVDININSEAYSGVNGSAILEECAKTLNIKIPKNNYKLANILIASATGLDMLDNKENVYKVIKLTNEYFEKHYSDKALFMGVPDQILNKYSPAIKNNDGANSLYVQMCIFLNEYYTNLNKEPNSDN